MNEFVILNNSWWNSLSYQLPWQSEMHISKPCMWGTFSQPWRFWLNQQTGLRRDLPWNHFRHILDQDISQFQPLKRSRFYAWSSRPFTKLSVVLSQWILNPRLVKQILLLFLRPHSWLLLSLFFFFWFLLLTLEGPRAQSLDVFSIITHILGELIQSIGSSDSQIYIFHSNLSAELQTYIHNCLFPISHWTSNRQFKLVCPKLKPQFLPTPSHKHPAPTRPPVLS